jgi:polysaccharide export outer membrane protein
MKSVWRVFCVCCGSFLLFLACSPVPFHRISVAANVQQVQKCSSHGPSLFPGDAVEVICYASLQPIEEYQIQVNDVVVVRYPKFPDYSLEQPVKPDGSINLPRLHSVRIAHKSLEDAYGHIASLYDSLGWRPEFFLALSSYDGGTADVKNIFTRRGNGSGREVLVRPDGYADFPILGDIAVAGTPFSRIDSLVTRRYQQRFPRLRFDLSMRKAGGSRVFIFGRIVRPGGYELSQTQTLAELLALSGGPLPGARLNDIVLIRALEDSVQCRRLEYRRALQKKPEQALYRLCPGTVVFVPSSPIYSISEFTRAVSDVLFFRGFGVGLNWGFSFSNPVY